MAAEKVVIDRDGNVVDAGSPEAAFILSREEAERRGLLGGARAKAVEPAEDKAVAGPREKRARRAAAAEEER